MDFFTHLVFGALLYNLFLKELPFYYIHYAVFFAVLPDLDIFLAPLKRIFKSNYLEHRSASHSYITGIFVSTFLSSIFSLIIERPFYIFWLIGIGFYGLHVSLDLLTTTRIPCFYPISKKEYCFYVEKAGSSFTLFTSLSFLIAISILNFQGADIKLIMQIIDFFTYFFIFYYFYRLFLRAWVNSHLNKSQKYFPGVFPLYYFVFEKVKKKSTLMVRIEKRSPLFKSKVLYNSISDLTNQEMNFFKKSLEICMQDYYFAKWTIIPILSKSEHLLVIRFFFMEPMIHSRAVFLQFEFDLTTSELITNHQSYGQISSKI